MARERFIIKRFSPESMAKIAQCREIIEEYTGQGFRLTLRQLYYQLVSRDLIQNREREYKNLSALVSEARLAGLLNWGAIEDRIRQPRVPTEFENLGELIQAALYSYRLPRWRGQSVYAELWVEKDALAGVLAPLALDYHVTMMVNRGYSSQSAMYEASKRFLAAQESGRDCVLFYLGDHDPSGEDMVRDIGARLTTFGAEVDVRKLALTMKQVDEYNPPPNPAKMTDPRAAEYVAEHGGSSWEVDALPPNVLTGIIREAIGNVINNTALLKVLKQEKRDGATLRTVLGVKTKTGKKGRK